MVEYRNYYQLTVDCNTPETKYNKILETGSGKKLLERGFWKKLAERRFSKPSFQTNKTEAN
jgi:hypothetical protein